MMQDFTGERYIPNLDSPEISYEHWHRYLYATLFAKGKVVLDIACGEGYGSHLLAQSARHVVGVDISAEAINHAASTYVRKNLEFKVGSLESIPIEGEALFDGVISFESIEHIDEEQQHAFMRETKRILKPGGFLLVSTPNRLAYSDIPAYDNEFHVKEFYINEFRSFLDAYFKQVRLIGQRIYPVSYLWDTQGKPSKFVEFRIDFSTLGFRPTADEKVPLYVLAICSDKEIRGIPQSVQVDLSGRILGARDEQIRTLRLRTGNLEAQVQALTEQVAEREAQVQALTEQVAEREAQVQALAEQVAEREAQVQALTEQVAERERQVQALRAQVTAMATSKAWRAGLLLRRIWGLLSIPFTLRRTYRMLRDLRLIRRSGYFDREWYLARNPDVAQSGMDPARHYLMHGGFEGRDPGPEFNSQWYLETYPDVLSAGMNPLTHYLRFGRWEGRIPVPHSMQSDGDLDLSPKAKGYAHPVSKVNERFFGIVDWFLPHGSRRRAYFKRLKGLLRESSKQSLDVSRRSGEEAFNGYADVYFEMVRQASASSEDYVGIMEGDVDGSKARVKAIAFYLPQFHPIPENDAWWGKGFTEWTNVSKAVPQFLGHYQPHLPGELGFYDLRVREVQRRQVELAKKYGIYGFCFHYYWFDGKRLLDLPLREFMNDPEIDMPFCVCWANENWTRRWDGRDNEVLIEQRHNPENDKAFARDLVPILEHKNYIHINDRPLLIIYRARLLPDPRATAIRWREYFKQKGVGEPYLVAAQVFEEIDPQEIGFDAAVEFPPNTPVPLRKINDRVELLNPDYAGQIYSYADMAQAMSARQKPDYQLFKAVFPQWDREPRTPGRGHTFAYSSPELYKSWLSNACRTAAGDPDPEKRLVFINAWNEWGEGAHLEPDRRYGYAYLQATAEVISKYIENKNGDLPGEWSVLFVSHDACRGGAQAVLLDLLEWLRKHTFLKLKVLCLEGGEWLDRFAGMADTAVLSDLIRKADANDPQRLAAAILRFVGEKPDLIYGNTAVSARAYPALALIGSPIITHMHEMASSVQRYAHDYVDAMLDKTKHFIACSDKVREYLVEGLGVSEEKVSVVHSSIKAESGLIALDKRERRKLRRALGLERDKFLVLGCGLGMPFRKGADLFIDVARDLKRKNIQGVHLYWVGDFDDKEQDQEGTTWLEYKSQAKMEGLQEHITFLGLKQNVRDHMLAGDVFLLPSREDPFPLVALEAAECGLPIVCFDGAGGMPEFVSNDAGFVVPFGDIEEMSERVIQLLEDEDLRERMGACAREKLLEGFVVERTAPHILSVWRKVAGKKPAVSVIVPNYNHARYLRERLDSIFDQTFRDFEVILLDDASTDGSLEILERYAKREGARLIVNGVNSGSPFSQWLKGIDEANSEIVWIAESDDACDSHFLEKLLPAFRDEKVNLAYCNSHIIDETGNIVGDYLKTDYLRSISETKWTSDYCIPAEQEISEALGIKNTILSASSVLFRVPSISPEMRRQLEGMHIAGDWMMALLAIEKGYICYVSDKLNYHRRHSDSVIGQVLRENRLNALFSEMRLVHEYVFSKYRLGLDFKNRWEEYVTNQWRELRPGRPLEEMEEYYPLREMKGRLEIQVDRDIGNNPHSAVPSQESAHDQAPIIVYTMGKVGSQSVFETLNRQDLGVQLYHAHVLNELDEIAEAVKIQLPNPVNTLAVIRQGKMLRNLIEQDQDKEWRIITLVRDPVAQDVSRFFHAIEEVIPNARQRLLNNEIPTEELVEIFIKGWDHQAALSWFDRQVNPVFGIDVFSQPFPKSSKSKRYSLMRKGRFSLLIMRLENLNECFSEAIEDFLGIKSADLMISNVASDKWYSKAYSEFLSNAILPTEYLADMYNSKLATHFYTEKEINRFIARWKRTYQMNIAMDRDSEDESKSEGYLEIAEKLEERLRSLDTPDEISIRDLLKGQSDYFYFWLLAKGWQHFPVLAEILPAMPSETIQHTFTGKSGIDTLQQAYNMYILVKSIAKNRDHPINMGSNILDFGCGWGRIIRFFLKDVDAHGLVGVDVNPDVIGLARSLRLRARFNVIQPLPPTSFQSESFDIIYLYSVFSHLSMDACNAWIIEFQRLLRPGGIIIATTRPRWFISYCDSLRRNRNHDSWQLGAAAAFPDAQMWLDRYDRGEFCHSPVGGGSVLNTSFYGETAIPAQYVYSKWAPHFSSAGFIADADHKLFDQNVIVLQR